MVRVGHHGVEAAEWEFTVQEMATNMESKHETVDSTTQTRKSSVKPMNHFGTMEM
jgi:hypothetical protein